MDPGATLPPRPVVVIVIAGATVTGSAFDRHLFTSDEHVIVLRAPDFRDGLLEDRRRQDREHLRQLLAPVRYERLDTAKAPFPVGADLAALPQAPVTPSSRTVSPFARLFGGPRERRALRAGVERKDAA